MIGILFVSCAVTVNAVLSLSPLPPLPRPPLPPGSRNVCPQIGCPRDAMIRDVCRKAEFVIGRDGQTACRVCDSDLCGPKNEVCPQIRCPGYIPQSCRIAQYDIGSDGITKCPMCDKDGCLAYGASFKAEAPPK